MSDWVAGRPLRDAGGETVTLRFSGWWAGGGGGAGRGRGGFQGGAPGPRRGGGGGAGGGCAARPREAFQAGAQPGCDNERR